MDVDETRGEKSSLSIDNRIVSIFRSTGRNQINDLVPLKDKVVPGEEILGLPVEDRNVLDQFLVSVLGRRRHEQTIAFAERSLGPRLILHDDGDR